MELKDTIEGMTSDDYIERFKAEYNQVSIRLNKLATILDNYHKKELPFTLECPITLLEVQAGLMVKYKDVLRARAKYEGIKLD